MFDKLAYDRVDIPLDTIFWAGERILSKPYPLVAQGVFTGNFELPFKHFCGVGTIRQWTGKFAERLELAPSAREWFVMRSSAMGHQKHHFDPKYAVSDLSTQLYIVTDEPRFLLPVETPVVIEYMHWLRQYVADCLSVTNVHKGSDGFINALCNYRKGNYFSFYYFTGNLVTYLLLSSVFNIVFLAHPPIMGQKADDTGNCVFVGMCRSYCALGNF
jgi:hypothetical protein